MSMSINRSFSARLLALSATACLAATFAVGAPAQIFHHSKKSKKTTPSDPLAGVTSKQPDKELFDKAMLALRERQVRRSPPRSAGAAHHLSGV